MSIEELSYHLKELRLSGVLEHYIQSAVIAQSKNQTYEEYLNGLLRIELETRRMKRILRLKKEAKLPFSKSLDNYDYDSIKGITIKDIKGLINGDFVKKASNLVFYGSFGLGKTHLAIGLIEKLCELNFKCLFITTNNLIEMLIEAQQNLRLSDVWKKLDKYDLIACDELGYIPQLKSGADLFFQFISQRYERKSLIITTNLAYSDWSKVFLNETTTAAAVDRIIHRCKTFTLSGPSRRMTDAKKKLDSGKDRN
jgi:DNA replication protein DnaC